MGKRTGSASGNGARPRFPGHGGEQGPTAVGAHAVSGGARREAFDHAPRRQSREDDRRDPTLEHDLYHDEGGRGVTPRSRPEAWSRAVPPGGQPHERAKPTVLASEDGEKLPAAPAMLPAANGTVRSVDAAMRGGMAPNRKSGFRRSCQ